jgi:hypothetical protein
MGNLRHSTTDVSLYSSGRTLATSSRDVSPKRGIAHQASRRFMKFAISAASSTDHESSAVIAYSISKGIEYRIVARPKDVPGDFIPVGAVDWVEDVLGMRPIPDYYPEFLSPYLHRKVWRADQWPHGQRVFIKPSDRHKRFTGFVTSGTWKGKKKPPYWCSERVIFVSEWRWYIAAGKAMDVKWCCGEKAPAPALGVSCPSDYHGAVDFGLLDNGKIALVEANVGGYSTGWYGTVNDAQTYVEWLAACWVYLKNKRTFP